MDKEVTNRLKFLRKRAGLTQMELAKKVGIAQSYIANIEVGKRDIDFGLARRLADALDVKPYELLPKEWQPEDLSEEEKEFLKLFRKSRSSYIDNADTDEKAG